MSAYIDIHLKPEEAFDGDAIEAALQRAGKSPSERAVLTKRSIDARKRQVMYRLRYAIDPQVDSIPEIPFRKVGNAEEIYIAGSGPCGLFAALKLIELGLKPIIVERGKDVRSRRRDLAKLNREHIVNPESNYCFGEGGAGTYSDGKLYTRSKKRGDVNEVLNLLIGFGAPEEIAIDAHPHIGTNKLPQIIQSVRNFIQDCGGEIRFETKLTDLQYDSGGLQKIALNGDWMSCKNLILATGHSARDIFQLLHHRKIRIEAKPFALGVRVEHPQEVIDRIQYHCDTRNPYLPPASYNLVTQVENRGVYSFCMCPGGIIAPCATAPEEIVTNGWSPSKRNNPFANSGVVVSVSPEIYDARQTGDPLKALVYQAEVEKAAWKLGGGGQVAPAQRMVDFDLKRVSNELPESSYQPGIKSADLRECLPKEIHQALGQAFRAFGRKMKGYFTNEAILVATESRTSSPVRIPRNADLEHTEVAGLYPAGEGAGYAGGIVSAAMDGQRVATKIAQKIKSSS